MNTITTVYGGDMSFEAIIGKHRVVVDAIEAMGGKGRGPTASELFLASLSSCVAVFVAAYCERTDLDTTGLTVDVSYERTEHRCSSPTSRSRSTCRTRTSATAWKPSGAWRSTVPSTRRSSTA